MQGYSPESQVLAPQSIVTCFVVVVVVLFVFFLVFCFLLFFFSLFLGIVVFCLFVFGFLFIYLFFIYFFIVAANGREGCVLSSFCAFFFYFCRGRGYFIVCVGGVSDSSSAGPSLT